MDIVRATADTVDVDARLIHTGEREFRGNRNEPESSSLRASPNFKRNRTRRGEEAGEKTSNEISLVLRFVEGRQEGSRVVPPNFLPVSRPLL